ncbi:acyl transferase/acyl hydrolase/lysophospholipase [Scheffersomyces coipomensis]|uniref:acyl transferase/acyl hydrolase/lysophospholipase n=1 Tax=Scheffersomyces coipomensis TaxID=1788519 RepID=UPI00315CAF7C
MTAERLPLFEEDKTYINEDHIHSFAKALVWEEDDSETSPTTPSGADWLSRASSYADFPEEAALAEADQITDVDGEQSAISLTPVIKPDLITSKNDWFPLTNNVTSSSPGSRRQSKSHGRRKSIRPRSKPKSSGSSPFKNLRNEFRNSISYTILRWPLLILVLLWIIFLGAIYLSIRLYVALSEYYFTWTGHRKRLRDRLRGSTSYQEWIHNALELDKYLNLDKWSENPRFSYYDSKTIQLTIMRLKALRESNRDEDLMLFLQGCIKSNFAGIENRQLYSHRYYGTKYLVSEYYQEVVLSINKISESSQLSQSTRRKFFRIVSKNYGKTALCLSGGACFAYTHFGIVKALLDNDLLPTVISGTSCGGLVAALACTRTDEELSKLLVPELARKITACEDPWYIWMPRLWVTGAMFDAVTWARKSCFFTRGSTTFQEAYERTGRKLNVSTVPSDPHSPVILCNSITSPNCIIWSSLLASAAVPGILNPVVLMMKNPNNNQVVPFSLGNKWRDGSLRTDIPIDSLNTYYNVNFPIVSQVNPHISLFFFAPKGTVGRPVASPRSRTYNEKYAYLRGGFIAAALEQLLKLEITKWLRLIKSLDLLPHVMEQDWSNIFLQRFSGAITIWPRNRLVDFWYILSDPTEERLAEMILKGEKSMFPRLLFIKHRSSIEKAIEKGRTLSRLSNETKQPVFSSSEVQNDFEFYQPVYEDDGEDLDDDDDFEGDHTEIAFRKSLSEQRIELGDILDEINAGNSADDEEEDDDDYVPDDDEDDGEEYESSSVTDEHSSSDAEETGKKNFIRSIFDNSTFSRRRRNTVF